MPVPCTLLNSLHTASKRLQKACSRALEGPYIYDVTLGVDPGLGLSQGPEPLQQACSNAACARARAQAAGHAAPCKAQQPNRLHCACAGAEEGGKQSEDGAPGEVLAAYDQLWQVVKLPALRRFAVILLTFRWVLLASSLGSRRRCTGCSNQLS